MVIVTGGLGFIGSALVKALNNAGITDIIIVDDITDTKITNVENCKFDKILSIEYFIQNMYDYLPTMIFHEGAISSTTETSQEKLNYYNIEFSKKIIDYAVSKDILISYASSASVYGTSETFIETDQLDPKSLYAASKAIIDQYVTNILLKNPRAKIQGFRYFNVYGANELHKLSQSSPIFKFKKQLEKEQYITLFDQSNEFKRDFVSVNDVVAVKISMSKENANGIFNLGTGTAISFKEIADHLISKFGGSIQYIEMPNNIKQQYQKYTCANMDKLQSILPYTFTTVKEYIKFS